MPTLTYRLDGSFGLEIWNPIYDVLHNGVFQTPTATRFAVTTATGSKVVFTGDFTVTGGQITGGTVTGFTTFAGSTPATTWTDYKVSATAVVDALKHAINDNDQDAFWGIFWERPLTQYGTGGNDTLWASPYGGPIFGRGGNDLIWGNDGRDLIHGGAGNDMLYGGDGIDKLWGDSGRDSFGIGPYAWVDRIMDFNPKDDLFLLDEGIYTSVGTGFLSRSEFVIGKAAKTEDHHLIYNKATGALYYDADGAGGAAQVQIAQLSKNLALQAKNFAVFGGLEA